jgi:hypothetical protein
MPNTKIFNQETTMMKIQDHTVCIETMALSSPGAGGLASFNREMP